MDGLVRVPAYCGAILYHISTIEYSIRDGSVEDAHLPPALFAMLAPAVAADCECALGEIVTQPYQDAITAPLATNVCTLRESVTREQVLRCYSEYGLGC